MLRIEEISLKYLDELDAFKKEVDEIDSNSPVAYSGCRGLKGHTSREYVENSLANNHENDYLKANNLVPATVYLILNENDHLIGILDFRHHINHPILSQIGGHIGYSIRPSERRKGYGKEMLHLALAEIKRTTNLDKLLITCYDFNEGSRKIIEANGGVFEGTTTFEEETYRRYWINL